ncbi:MAG: hypothetical protein PUB73_05865 [Bacteroidales bacterium]|nr:hypothetical protein [Bacteroidales bacterium]
MSTEIKQMSAFDIFSASQETLDDAKRKSSEESRKQTKYLRLSQDGTYAVRILPLAPIMDAEGNVTLPRKGYEYPVKELILKIKGKDKKGKETQMFVNVCNAKYRFQNLENDLIDLYVSLACQQYADDEALCKKIKGTSFNGGLKYDSKRCMYVFDIDKRGDGLQILQLSFSQYKELEERKIKLWEKLCKKDPKALCPISSINAFPLEITRSTENKKTNYAFNIDTVSGEDELTEEELQMLLDAPRLPDTIYRYSRYHLEATIEFLKQYDEALDINVMESKEIADCIEQIKTLLPADDTSHFSLTGSQDNGGSENGNGLNSLWAMYDAMEEKGLDDKSDEGAELRASIREFIEDNNLDITITRRDSNLDLLNAIEDLYETGEVKGGKKVDGESDSESEKETEEAPARRSRRVEEPEDEDENDGEPASPRSTRNDDTNEPAAPSRRAARPQRRR